LRFLFRRCILSIAAEGFESIMWGLDLFMVLYKAGKNNAHIKEWGIVCQLQVAFGISAVLALAFYFVLGPNQV